MNRQTTYFLQKVLSGMATSAVYALFDNYRYNQRQNRYKPRRRKDPELNYYKPTYDRRKRY